MTIATLTEPGTTAWTAADLVEAIHKTPLTLAEFAMLVRTIRDSIPDLLPPDPALATRMRSAARLSPGREPRPLLEETKALDAVVQFNTSYPHYVAATQSRVAYHVGRRLGGDEGQTLKPHLDIIQEQIPKTWHRKPKTPTPVQ